MRRSFPPAGPQRLFGRALLILVCSVAVACKAELERGTDPAARTRSFLSAVDRGNCDEAWTYFSAQTQRRIEEESARYIKESPYYAEEFAPKRLYCGPTLVNPYPAYVAESAELIRVEGDTAVVRVQEKIPEGYALPGFFPTSFRMEAREVYLTYENAAWKITRAIRHGG